MAGNFLLYYFGNDEAYFKALQGEFKKSTRMAIDFQKISETDPSKIQTLMIRIFKSHPAAVFIDFSKNTVDYLHLARLISRTPMEHRMLVVGLMDLLTPPDIQAETFATGVNLTHIKNAEVFDVVFDVAKIIAPNDSNPHGFATATLKEDWEAGIVCKVGYVHDEGLHVETDFRMSKGDRIRLAHSWRQNKVVPSKEMFVKDATTSNLFYHFKYGVDVDFLFVDEFLPPEGMEEQTIVEKKAEREDSVRFHKKQLKKWIEDNLSRSQEKKAKILIIDREFHFFQNQPKTDKHPYTIRCVPFMNDIPTELERLQPQVIAFQLEEEGNGSKNNNEALVQLVTTLKSKFPDLQPFIIVFNSKTSSKELQESLQYAQTMSTVNEISVDVLIRMADIFEQKMLKNVMQVKSKDKVFIKKNNPASIAEVAINVKVVKLSESDMIFQTDSPVAEGSNLHLTQPVNMYVHVLPSKAQGKIPEYYGLIHCLGEVDKKELRRYVNSVFFREHDEKKDAATEEFKKLNEKVAEAKKVAAEKAAQEEEKKKELEFPEPTTTTPPVPPKPE